MLCWTLASGGDVVGPASATANAIARYNSTSGKIIKNSGIVIDDYTTATQNNVRLQADDGATANITLVLSPKGAGALTAQKPDGATTGGNARGQYAVDWQMSRGAANQVASGNYATIGGGANNAAPDPYTTVAGGSNNKIISGSNVANATISGGGDNTIGNGSIAGD